jgi:hypothetical protein
MRAVLLGLHHHQFTKQLPTNCLLYEKIPTSTSTRTPSHQNRHLKVGIIQHLESQNSKNVDITSIFLQENPSMICFFTD